MKNKGLAKLLGAAFLSAACIAGITCGEVRAEDETGVSVSDIMAEETVEEADAKILKEDGRQPVQQIVDFRYPDEDEQTRTTVPQEGTSAKNIWLLPGDTLEVLPDTWAADTCRYVAFEFGPEVDMDELSKYLKIVDTATYFGVTKITKVENISDQPVWIRFGGGGGFAGGYKDKSDISYYCKTAGVRVAVAECPIKYVYKGRWAEKALKEKNIFFYEDVVDLPQTLPCEGISNYYGLKKDMYYGLCSKVYLNNRPYAEGYYFNGWVVDQTSDKNYYVRLEKDEETGKNYLTWELSTALYRDFYYAKDEAVTITAHMEKGWTLTLDAGKGTIEGFPKKIYEIENNLKVKDFDLSGYIPVREGYLFDGWYADKKFTTPIESLDQLDINSSKYVYRLYAKWTKLPAADSTIKSGFARYIITKAARQTAKGGVAGGTVEYKCPTTKSRNIIIPATITYKGITYRVTSIADDAFFNNANAKSITVNATGITKVGKKAFTGISDKCKITVPSAKLKKYKKLFKASGLDKKCTITAE